MPIAALFATLKNIMDGIIGIIFLVAIALFIFQGSNFLGAKKPKVEIFNKEGKKMNSKLSPLAIGGIAILLVIVVLASQSIRIIGAGERGVIFNAFSGTSSRTLGEGLHFVIPFIENVTKYDIRIQSYTMSSRIGEGSLNNVDDSLLAKSSNGLDIGVDLSIQHRLNTSNLYKLHKEVGPNYEDKIIRKYARSIFYEVVSKFEATQLYTSEGRTELQELAFIKTKESLSKYYIECDDFLIRKLFFPPEFEKSIEEKHSATQRREAEIIKAQTDADAKIIRAEADALALEKVQPVLSKNKQLIQYQWIKSLGDNVKILVVPNGSNTFIDPSQY